MYLVSWAQNYQAPIPTRTVMPRTPFVATMVAQSRSTATPAEENYGIDIVFNEPVEHIGVNTASDDMIILKTEVYYRAEPTGDTAYWIVTGDYARTVADTMPIRCASKAEAPRTNRAAWHNFCKQTAVLKERLFIS